MLIKCPRIKRVYVKFCALIIVIIIIVLSFKLLVRKSVEPISELEQIYEDKLSYYERKIIPNLGHNGEEAFLEGEDAKKGEEALKKFALNTVLSDRMPLDRKLRDPRNAK